MCVFGGVGGRGLEGRQGGMCVFGGWGGGGWKGGRVACVCLGGGGGGGWKVGRNKGGIHEVSYPIIKFKKLRSWGFPFKQH